MKSVLTSVLVIFFLFSSQLGSTQGNEDSKIQVAILLDTSNSMDGLIDQAKSRLWSIVNTLTTLKYKGKTPHIEIALYEYGNSGLSQESNYIRQVTPLTTDLDYLSEVLFGLKTNGGLEYCGAVIRDAVRNLKWGDDNADMHLVYIAGNEEFNQGRISYKEAIAEALIKDIYVNTIYCGDRNTGIRELWQDGAQVGKGKYFNIDSDAKVRFIETPFDAQIKKCNERLNSTYVSYGSSGETKKMNQSLQDKNASSVSSSNYAERVVSKSKMVYQNDSWDMVDKFKKDKNAIKNLKPEDLPKELKGKTKEEITHYVEEKSKERDQINKEIGKLAIQRQSYIDNKLKESSGQDDLGNAINGSILAFALKKGYKQEE